MTVTGIKKKSQPRKEKQPRTLRKGTWRKDLHDNYELYLLSIPAVIFFIIFCYLPMYGVQIAFRDFIPSRGITGSEWVGLENFKRFFRSYNFKLLLGNTLKISIYQILFGFPCPIILAIMLNELRNSKFKKVVQMVTYAPHFISAVAIVGMLNIFLSPSSGIINHLIVLLGGEPIYFMSKPEYFRTIFVSSGIWQSVGWGSIIYVATLSGIDPQLGEAATIDGANKLQRIWNVDIPGIMPTMVIMLIMRVGHVMSVGFEKIILMQNDLNMATSDVISTYVYRCGLINADYSFSAAVGLFNSVINLILLISVNHICKKLNNTSLW